MTPALLFRFSWDLSYHEPVSSASPWCFPVNACMLCHTHSIPYMLIYMSVPLLEIREQSRWISRKQIYFSIVYESFLLNFDLHVFDYNWDWTFFFTFVIFPLHFFLFSYLFRTFPQFFTCMLTYFPLVDFQDSAWSRLFILFICFVNFCQVFTWLSIFIYCLAVLIFKAVLVKSRAFIWFYSDLPEKGFKVAYKYTFAETR